jgi:hypothetical protein
MEEEIDPFDWMLAEALGMTIGEMNERMSAREHTSWRAFWRYRSEMQKLAAQRARHGR